MSGDGQLADLDELLQRAKRTHALAEEEVAALISELNDERSRFEKYRLLHVLLESHDSRAEPIAERFLDYKKDPMVAGLAVRSLYQYFGALELHIELIRAYVGGVPWDDDNEVRESAITAAGIYLKDHDDEALLSAILQIYADETNEDSVTRTAALFALGRAVGESSVDRRGFSPELLNDTELVQEILERVRLLT